MKRYQKYMDGVTASDTLKEKLDHLNETKKRPQIWRRYGAMAAALVLVAGLGAWALGQGGSHGAGPGSEPISSIAVGQTETIKTEPGVVAQDGPGSTRPSGGGYEVNDGVVAAYYMLPYIVYNDEVPGIASDYSLAPPSATWREAKLTDVAVLVGGIDNLRFHLGWPENLTWGGVVWLDENGAPCAAALHAEGDGLVISFELMLGGEIPDCVVFPDASYERTEFCGVEITGLKNGSYAAVDGVELRESRKISFVADGMGHKLTVYGTDAGQVGELCARFARWGIIDGFRLSHLTQDGSVPDVPSQAPAGDEATTPAYDPNRVSPSQAPKN